MPSNEMCVCQAFKHLNRLKVSQKVFGKLYRSNFSRANRTPSVLKRIPRLSFYKIISPYPREMGTTRLRTGAYRTFTSQYKIKFGSYELKKYFTWRMSIVPLEWLKYFKNLDVAIFFILPWSPQFTSRHFFWFFRMKFLPQVEYVFNWVLLH